MQTIFWTFRSAHVSLKLRSRSPKSNQLFPSSQQCIYASFVKIHQPVQKIMHLNEISGCRRRHCRDPHQKQYIPPPSGLGEHNNISQCIHHVMGSKENLNQEMCNELFQKQISLVCHLLCTSPSPKRGFQYQRISFNSL